MLIRDLACPMGSRPTERATATAADVAVPLLLLMMPPPIQCLVELVVQVVVVVAMQCQSWPQTDCSELSGIPMAGRPYPMARLRRRMGGDGQIVALGIAS